MKNPTFGSLTLQLKRPRQRAIRTFGLSVRDVEPCRARPAERTVKLFPSALPKEAATMMHWYGNGMGGGGFVLMMINMLLFWGLVIAAVVVLVRYFGGARNVWSGPHQGEQILAERFARGELDQDEYERRLDVLRRA